MQVTMSASPAGISPDTRALRAGRQFEAILLNMVFGDLERTFSQLPDSKTDGVSHGYDGFAMQSLASGISDRGGVGLSTFITRALLKHANRGS